MSSSIILEKISEALKVYSEHLLFDVEISIRRVEDSRENIFTDLQRKVDAGIISEQDSVEFEYIADLWLNLYKSFICRSAGATFADRDVIKYLIELYEVKQISKELFVEIALELCRYRNS
jgi:hypothetical protein